MNADPIYYTDYVELHIEGLTRGRELHNAFIMVLQEEKSGRILPVLIEQEEYHTLLAALRDHDYTPSKLMNQLAHRVGMVPVGVRIQRPKQGRTQALIDFALVNEIVSMAVPVAEAAVAALETHTSLWMLRETFERQMATPAPKDAVALPLSAMTGKLLEEALQAAVEEDNFELARVLRDELLKRTDAP